MDAAHAKVELRNPDHLHIPGRVLILFQRWKVNEEDEEQVKNLDGVIAKKDLRCIVTDGSCAVLRFFEVAALRMVTDHVTASYYRSVEQLKGNHMNDLHTQPTND